MALEYRGDPDAVLMIFTAYIDEADTHGPAPDMIMAGFLGSGRQWQLFLRRLREMQRKDGFNIFHATEFKHHAGEFAGWGDAKSLAFAHKLTGLVARDLEQGIALDLPYDADAEYRDTPNPKGVAYDSHYGLCFRYCLSHLINTLAATGKKHRLRVVLERGHKNAGNCERIFDEIKLTHRAKGIHMLGDFTLARKDEAAPLMAADFLAHSYMMLRDSGDLVKTDATGEALPRNYSLKQSRGLRYLGLEPDAIPDLKKRLQQDRWIPTSLPKAGQGFGGFTFSERVTLLNLGRISPPCDAARQAASCPATALW